jgi:thiol-disulfide isomerase/thioredoxin
MKTQLSFALLLAMGVESFVPHFALAQKVSTTATNLENIDLSDTEEDPAYAEAGEQLAKEAAEGVIGKAAPLATIKTIDGDLIDLATIYGKKPVYIKFWATWCTPCRQQMPGFEKTYKSIGDKMQVIAVNMGYSDDEASVRAFRKKYGLTMPIVIDGGQLAKLFHGSVTPQHVLIGKDARFAYIGHAENDNLEKALTQAVSEKAGGTAVHPEEVNVEPLIALGDKLPDLSLPLLNGKSRPLKAQPGKLLALQFFSSWCEWYLEDSRPTTAQACTRVRETIEGLSTKNLPIDWIGIAGGPWATEQDLADYKVNYKVTIPLGLDASDSLFRTFGIRDIPTIALINDAGQLVRLIGPEETDLAGIVKKTCVESGLAE